MKEIQVKGNETGLRVFINDAPDLKQIPKDIADSMISVLEMEISEHFEQGKNETTDTKI